MRKFVLASHGSLAEGIKNSVEMISGKQNNLYAFCMKEGESPTILKERVEKIISDSKTEDEIVLVSDFPGGSVNTMLVSFLNQNNIYLVSGMNSMLVLSLILSKEPIDSCLKNAINSGKNTIKRIELEEDNEEDDFFD